jgi:hypothetical protein
MINQRQLVGTPMTGVLAGPLAARAQPPGKVSPQTTMRYDDNRRDLAGQVAASLASVL